MRTPDRCVVLQYVAATDCAPKIVTACTATQQHQQRPRHQLQSTVHMHTEKMPSSEGFFKGSNASGLLQMAHVAQQKATKRQWLRAQTLSSSGCMQAECPASVFPIRTKTSAATGTPVWFNSAHDIRPHVCCLRCGQWPGASTCAFAQAAGTCTSHKALFATQAIHTQATKLLLHQFLSPPTSAGRFRALVLLHVFMHCAVLHGT